jgi:8-oxo-dGTP diphosphatase
MPYTYKYPRPALTVDCILFGFDEQELKVLLIRRRHEPFAGMWALPGGFVDMDETLDEAALRELREETGVEKVSVEQLHTFGAVDRDPRGRTVSVVYYALVNPADQRPQADSDAREVAWFAVSKVPPLAFDHDEILAKAIERLRFKARRFPVGLDVLPGSFTISKLRRLYEAILRERINVRGFGRKMRAAGMLVPLEKDRKNAGTSSKRHYRFDKRRYGKLQKQGFDFTI